MGLNLKRSEREAWRDAADAGVVLPDELLEVYALVDRMAQQLAGAETVDVEKVTATHALLQGATAEDATKAEEAYLELVEQVKVRRSALTVAHRTALERVDRWIGAHRDLLIVEHLRPAVETVIAAAVELLPKLKQFAPNYDALDVAGTATPHELTAWRAAGDLDRKHQAYVTAWFSSWRTSTSIAQAADSHKVPEYLRIDAPGGLHVWEQPNAVLDVDVRDGRNTEILHIARWADTGGYRLAGGQEVLDLTQMFTTTFPWLVGERQPRQVLLLGDKVEPAPQRIKRPGVRMIGV